MRRQRLLLLLAGALTGIALVLTAAVLWPQPARAKHTPVVCLPYFLIPKEQVCGPNVIYTNPDGSRVRVGSTSHFAPMPKPLPFQRRNTGSRSSS